MLDNFEHVLAAAPLVAKLVAGAPGVTLLDHEPGAARHLRGARVPRHRAPGTRPASSRSGRRSSGGSRRYGSSSIAHVPRGPTSQLSESNANAVAELCVRLDGLPLALELAAARLMLLSPGAILDRLARRLEPLRAAPGADVPERHRTLRAAIEWSYDLLAAPRAGPPDEPRRLRRRLHPRRRRSRRRGPRARHRRRRRVAPEATTCSGPSAWAETSRASACWRRSASTRSSGWTSAATARRCGAVTRRSMRSWRRRPSPPCSGRSSSSWAEQLDAELANIRAALTWAAESGEAEAGLRIGAGLWRYWQMRGLLREARERLERLLAVGSGSSGARASAQATVASIAIVQGDHEAARRFLELSLPVHRRLGDERRVASSLAHPGRVCRGRRVTPTGRSLSPRRDSRSRSAQAILR